MLPRHSNQSRPSGPQAAELTHGGAIIECLIVLPFLFGLIYGLLHTSTRVAQGQRVALASVESGRLEFDRCLRDATPQRTAEILACFQASTARRTIPWSGILPNKSSSPHGLSAQLGLPPSHQPVRLVLALCPQWNSNEGGGSGSFRRSCFLDLPPAPDQLPELEIRDSTDVELIASESTKRTVWQRFGALIERRGFVLISEVASATPSTGLGESEDISLVSVF